MKCILHIGTEKTGTTTIQNFLNLNREKLLEQGFIYTKSTGVDNNRGLAVAAYNSFRRDDFTKEKNIDTDKKLIQLQREIVKKLTREVSSLTSCKKNNTLIFSSEHIQSRLIDIEEIKRLKDILYKVGATDITILVYLRRPAEIANSLYSTLIKFGGHSKSPYLPKNPLWNNICNHKKTLEKFSSVFGENNIKPRIYENKELVKGSIIDDFRYIAEIKDAKNYRVPEDSNRSLSFLGIEILRRVNKTIPKWTKDKKDNKVREGIVLYFEKNFSDGEKYIMEDKLYKKYDIAFRESNEWVRKKYFPSLKKLFNEEKLNNNTSLPINNEDLDKISNIISDIWNDKKKEIIKPSMKSFFLNFLRR